MSVRRLGLSRRPLWHRFAWQGAGGHRRGKAACSRRCAGRSCSWLQRSAACCQRGCCGTESRRFAAVPCACVRGSARPGAVRALLLARPGGAATLSVLGVFRCRFRFGGGHSSACRRSTRQHGGIPESVAVRGIERPEAGDASGLAARGGPRGGRGDVRDAPLARVHGRGLGGCARRASSCAPPHDTAGVRLGWLGGFFQAPGGGVAEAWAGRGGFAPAAACCGLRRGPVRGHLLSGAGLHVVRSRSAGRFARGSAGGRETRQACQRRERSGCRAG